MEDRTIDFLIDKINNNQTEWKQDGLRYCLCGTNVVVDCNYIDPRVLDAGQDLYVPTEDAFTLCGAIVKWFRQYSKETYDEIRFRRAIGVTHEEYIRWKAKRESK